MRGLADSTAQLLLVLSVVLTTSSQAAGIEWTTAKKEEWKRSALEVFYHGYDNYMLYAFPHDELKPISKDFTDSLGEFGNPNPPQCHQGYQGVALTLIDSLSTLAVIGNQSEFEKGVWWLAHEVSFDVDLKVNVFEANIRLLGGLLSAHLLASDSTLGLMRTPYAGQLLTLATDLGDRLMEAFEASPTDIPYAWVNLQKGVGHNELLVEETNTAAVGSFTLEMGLLSRLTGNPCYEKAAVEALSQLWGMRSPLDLVGSSIDMTTGSWNNRLGGTGAGADSFYEYLLKAYVLFGRTEYWEVFQGAYRGVMQHYRSGAWYDDADIVTGRTMHQQFQSLQAFWPGMQVLAGDVLAAQESYWHYFTLWKAFGALPERFLYGHGQLHSNQQQYALRPELMESTFYLYQATQDTMYLDAGVAIIEALYDLNWVDGGWASVQSVHTRKLEDHMPSYFLAEACKYLFLLFDDSFLQKKNYIFTTEGHVIPVLSKFHEPSPASAQLEQLVQQPPSPLRQAPPVKTMVLSPDQPQLWQLFQSMKQHFSSSSTEAPVAAVDSGHLEDAKLMEWIPADTLRMMQERNDASALQECASQHSQQGSSSVECAPSQQQLHSSSQGCNSIQVDDQSAAASFVTSCGGSSEDNGASSDVHQTSVKPASAALQRTKHTGAVLPAVKQKPDALRQRVCPSFGHPQVQVISLCHMVDVKSDHSCWSHVDCGVESVSCRDRICSAHGFCQAS
ncbi:TPA: hypothetical protein ACH3X1_005291 [Trebouxia sp. C0004]